MDYLIELKNIGTSNTMRQKLVTVSLTRNEMLKLLARLPKAENTSLSL